MRHEFLEKEPGFCYWPYPNMSNMTTLQDMAPSPSSMKEYLQTLTPSSAEEYYNSVQVDFGPNATETMPVNTDCIMDTDCGIRGNGVPAFIKIKRNWEPEVKGLAYVFIFLFFNRLCKQLCMYTLNES